MAAEARGEGAGRGGREWRREGTGESPEVQGRQCRPELLCDAPATREGALAAGECRMGPRSREPWSGLGWSFLIDNFFLSW